MNIHQQICTKVFKWTLSNYDEGIIADPNRPQADVWKKAESDGWSWSGDTTSEAHEWNFYDPKYALLLLEHLARTTQFISLIPSINGFHLQVVNRDNVKDAVIFTGPDICKLLIQATIYLYWLVKE